MNRDRTIRRLTFALWIIWPIQLALSLLTAALVIRIEDGHRVSMTLPEFVLLLVLAIWAYRNRPWQP